MEELFYPDDVTKKQKMVPIEKGVENIIISTNHKPKMVNLSKSLSLEMKGKYTNLWDNFMIYLFGTIQI